MNDFLILTNRNICPACRVRPCRSSQGPCHNCGVPLFPNGAPSRPIAYEGETGIRHWYAYHRIDGWKHRDFFMVEGAKPNSRVYKVPKLAKDYGRQITPGEVAARSAKSKRITRKAPVILPKRRFHKVYA